MRDPLTWSIPLGRLFGITVRVHLLFFLFIVGMWLRAATGKEAEYPTGSGLAMLVLLALLFISVLFHEFGHCYAARLVDGDAREVLLWPLGGLAYCEVPSTPRANFITAAGGPAVNLLLCVLCALVLLGFNYWPNLDPTPNQAWWAKVHGFDGKVYGSSFLLTRDEPLQPWLVLVVQFFWVNWFSFLLNVCLPGFPLDGGRMLQALLWPRMGYRRSMGAAIVIGFLVMLVVCIAAMAMNEVMVIILAWFIYQSCKHQWVLLETGGEESLFGYDFSQGYTSLERDQPAQPRRRRPNFFQRWLQRRAARKLQREQETQLAEERRMDELLEKIQRQGRESLTEEETRFLKRVADKYRNRN